MAMTKYASFESAEILDLKGSTSRVKQASLDKLSDFHDFRTNDGYLYARIRAISSRVNKNHDGWPSVELAGGEDVFNKIAGQRTAGFTVEADTDHEYGYSTFLGKPIFVDHHNSDPSRARGVIVDAKLHVDDHKTAAQHDPYYASAPENHTPPTWVELLLEVDAKSFPKLAKAIIEGGSDSSKGIDGFSMGCDVEKSVCNICKNAATTPHDYCKHVQMKGAEFDYRDPETGKRTSKRSYEDCYGIKFFEISAVFDPADETALTSELIHEGKTAAGPGGTHMTCPDCGGAPGYNMGCPICKGTGQAEIPYGHDGGMAPDRLDKNDMTHDPMYTDRMPAFGKTASPLPQSTMLKAPEDIDTLREDMICEVCGSDMDDTACAVCGWEKPPEGFDNPDLTKAKEHDMSQVDPAEQAPADPFGDGFGANPESEPTSNQGTLAHVTNDMAWETTLPSRVAYTNPDDEQPVVPNTGSSSDQPNGEKTLEDHTKPTTSSVRTAEDFLAAAGANETRRTMSNHRTADAASGAPAVATPDKSIDVDGVGGIMDASNEEASRADAQVDVEGEGGTGVEGVAADSTESVEQGTEKSKNVEKIPTKTFPKGDQADPVQGPVFHGGSWTVEATDDKVYPENDGGLAGGSANQGTQPVDPVGKPDERVDVLDHVTSPSNNSGDTDTWSGTDGNGVTRQADPVTGESLEGSDIVNMRGSSTHIFAAMKTADLEVELGLLAPERKYARAAELEQESPERLAAIHDYASRVRTAGVGRTTSARRLPSMTASTRGVGRDDHDVTKESSTEGADPEFIFGS